MLRVVGAEEIDRLTERVAALEAVAHPPLAKVPDADQIDDEFKAINERLRRLEFITRLLPGNKGWPAEPSSSRGTHPNCTPPCPICDAKVHCPHGNVGECKKCETDQRFGTCGKCGEPITSFHNINGCQASLQPRDERCPHGVSHLNHCNICD